ncbi:MAG: flagellar hook protein FlgE [Pseudomonadales bacterium]
MSFNTALSGLRAASAELEVTGNNVANASTTGFKSSRAEFGDIYANAFVTGGNQTGAGVVTQDISQQFSQGNVSFTENSLDMAINGNGFFVVKEDQTNTFTRAGLFGLDKENFVVNNSGARLQGYLADDQGQIGGTLADLQVNNQGLVPKPTTRVDETFNLAANDDVLVVRSTTTDGAAIGIAQPGVSNGYTAGTVDLNGVQQSIPSADSLSAGQIAQELSVLQGVSASATTASTITITGFPVNGSDLTVNGIPFIGNTATELAQNINGANGLTAIDDGLGNISVTSSTGQDISFDVSGGALSADVVGGAGSPITIAAAGTPQATVGGTVDITLENGTNLTNALATNVFTPNPTLTSVVNQFDPTNPATYNSVTSATIYDSKGIAHDLNQYFVKEPTGITTAPGTWTSYIQIDGQDVGPNDAAGVPTLASFTLQFNPDGTLDTGGSDRIVISNWTPRGSGDDVGVLGPQDPPTLPIPEPATSSNFEIDVTNATSFGSPFAVNALSQNGFATGNLTGVEVGETGELFARYSNGETKVLGQIALANFANPAGLIALGDTGWAESLESGQPLLGEPGTAQLGRIQAGALEDSNVDLTEQLVNLILAQRNFQANAKTIETADAITQTIINLR